MGVAGMATAGSARDTGSGSGQGFCDAAVLPPRIELETERSAEGGADEVSRYEIFVRSITIYSNFIRLNRNH